MLAEMAANSHRGPAWAEPWCWSITSLPSRLDGSVDASVLHTIEAVVIEWSHQIKDILSKDSAQPLLAGLHPLPKTEFEFWHTRTADLQCINDQVPPHLRAAQGCVLLVLSTQC